MVEKCRFGYGHGGVAIGSETSLTFTLLTPDDPPDQSTTGHLRYRLNHLLFADLRYSYGQ